MPGNCLTKKHAPNAKNINAEGNIMKPQGIDPHGDEKNLLGLGLFRRQTGPEKLEIELIIEELKKPKRNRNHIKLKKACTVVRKGLRSLGLNDLIPIADNPRSFARLVGKYDSYISFLPEEYLNDFYDLFHIKRGPKKSQARLDAEDYIAEHQAELRGKIVRGAKITDVAFSVSRATGCSHRIARDLLSNTFRLK